MNPTFEGVNFMMFGFLFCLTLLCCGCIVVGIEYQSVAVN